MLERVQAQKSLTCAFHIRNLNVYVKPIKATIVSITYLLRCIHGKHHGVLFSDKDFVLSRQVVSVL